LFLQSVTGDEARSEEERHVRVRYRQKKKAMECDDAMKQRELRRRRGRRQSERASDRSESVWRCGEYAAGTACPREEGTCKCTAQERTAAQQRKRKETHASMSDGSR